MSKQTAVEWMIEEVQELRENGDTDLRAVLYLLIKAKEMDEQNIISAYQQGYNNAYFNNPIAAIEYYNETFKNK